MVAMTYDSGKHDFSKRMDDAYADFMNGQTNAEEFIEDCKWAAKEWVAQYFPEHEGE
jgi:hypothetical protein